MRRDGNRVIATYGEVMMNTVSSAAIAAAVATATGHAAMEGDGSLLEEGVNYLGESPDLLAATTEVANDYE